MSKAKITLPNIITLSRLMLMPLFVLAFVLPFEGHFLVAAALFAIAALSDLLDGFLARILQQESAFGRFFDPVADKLVVSVALLFLLWQEHTLMLAFPVTIIICREITVSALREWMSEVGSRIHVSTYGKLKTVVQMLSIFCLIASGDDVFFTTVHSSILWWGGVILLYLATVLTLWSMFLYLKAAWPDIPLYKS